MFDDIVYIVPGGFPITPDIAKIILSGVQRPVVFPKDASPTPGLPPLYKGIVSLATHPLLVVTEMIMLKFP